MAVGMEQKTSQGWELITLGESSLCDHSQLVMGLD